jgi:hypothetical protein
MSTGLLSQIKRMLDKYLTPSVQQYPARIFSAVYLKRLWKASAARPSLKGKLKIIIIK